MGRGQGENTIRKWITLASEVAGFIGFAVGLGPVTFDNLWQSGARKEAHEAAVEIIARRYRELVDIFEKARPISPR